MRVTVGHVKGGVAKTTTAVHLALGLARSGRTLLVDADPDQDSAGSRSWSELAGDEWPVERCSVVASAARDMARRVRPMLDDYDHLVLDVGPKNPALLRQALGLSEHLVIPIRPSAQDIAEVPATMAIAAEVDELHPLTAAVLLVDVDARWVTYEREARELLAADGIPTMTCRVRHLSRYLDARGSVPAELGDYEHVLTEMGTT